MLCALQEADNEDVMPIEDADMSSGNDGSGSDKSSDSSENDSSGSESESPPRPSGSRELPPAYYATMPSNQLGMLGTKDHN